VKKPRGYDPSVDNAILIGTGAAHSIREIDDGGATAPVGRLIVPDPEQRRGWREHFVYGPADKPGSRPIGFGRRHEERS
jgi:hypothetical protein